MIWIHTFGTVCLWIGTVLFAFSAIFFAVASFIAIGDREQEEKIGAWSIAAIVTTLLSVACYATIVWMRS